MRAERCKEKLSVMQCDEGRCSVAHRNAVWWWMAKQCDAVCRRAQRCEAGPFNAAGRCNVTKDNAVCRESDDNNAVCMQCDVTRTSAERDGWNDKMRAAAAAEESAQKSTE